MFGCFGKGECSSKADFSDSEPQAVKKRLGSDFICCSVFVSRAFCASYNSNQATWCKSWYEQLFECPVPGPVGLWKVCSHIQVMAWADVILSRLHAARQDKLLSVCLCPRLERQGPIKRLFLQSALMTMPGC